MLNSMWCLKPETELLQRIGQEHLAALALQIRRSSARAGLSDENAQSAVPAAPAAVSGTLAWQVFIDGQDLKLLDAMTFRRHLGIVPQARVVT